MRASKGKGQRMAGGPGEEQRIRLVLRSSATNISRMLRVLVFGSETNELRCALPGASGIVPFGTYVLVSLASDDRVTPAGQGTQAIPGPPQRGNRSLCGSPGLHLLINTDTSAVLPRLAMRHFLPGNASAFPAAPRSS